MKSEKTIKSSITPVVMLGFALAFRQMSMTIVMPFISTYCKSLKGYTSLYAGLAIGIFGLMQAMFQIPFGVLSDRYGNKKMMMIGLTQVVAGLALAYYARSIGLLIFARALQGSGAVIGVGYSWAAGMAGEKGRVRAMSILGAFIAAAAALAFAAGPLLREIMPVNWMFLSCAILLFFNELYILFFIKDEKNRNDRQITTPETGVRALLRNKCFVIMNLSAFINNYMMVAVFYAVPVYLTKVTGETGMWKVFVPAISIAILMMKLAVRRMQKGFSRQVLRTAFLISAFSLILYFHKSSYVFLLLGTVMFMSGYVALATIVAVIVNNTVDDGYRGTANGIFNSFQYIGNFVGAIVTGALWSVSEDLTWFVTIGFGIAGFLLVTINGQYHRGVRKEEKEK